MTPIPVFICVPTDKARLSLRRFRSGADYKCEANGYCNADVDIRVVPEPRDEHGRLCADEVFKGEFPDGHELFPTKCACGYEFTKSDYFQRNCDTIYRNSRTGEYVTWEEMPLGALRKVPWLQEHTAYQGFDGKCLQVKIPKEADGTGITEWLIDSICSNCDRPDDHNHKCWCRNGPTEAEWARAYDSDAPYTDVLSIHVDKTAPEGKSTCSAGAGSIFIGMHLTPPGFHGFLHHGHVVSC